jgi:hypothetical protein
MSKDNMEVKQTKWQEAGENCVMGSIICTLSLIVLRSQIKEDKMDKERSTYEMKTHTYKTLAEWQVRFSQR